MAPIGLILAALKALASPLVTAVAPWVAPIGGLKMALRGASYAALALAVAWGTYQLARPPAKTMTALEAKRACDDALARAEVAALRLALDQRTAALKSLEQQADADAAALEQLIADKEAARAHSADPDRPVWAGTDVWLLAKSAGGSQAR